MAPSEKHVNTFEICKAVRNFSDNFLGVGIIANGKLVAMDAKPGVPIPDDARFEKMFFQTSLIAGIMEGNADFFGPARYFTMHFGNADLFFFLLESGIGEVLAIQVSRQHVHEHIVSAVNQFLAKNLAKTSEVKA